MTTFDLPRRILERTRAPRPITEDRMRLLKSVADPTRLGILDRLACCGERSHGVLEEELDAPTSRMSFHLKVLREAGLVESTRIGQHVCYRLAPDALDRLHAALPVLVEPDGEDG